MIVPHCHAVGPTVLGQWHKTLWCSNTLICLLLAVYSVVNGWYSTCLDWVEERHALSPNCISMQIVLGRTLFQLRPNSTVETRGKATGARSRRRRKKTKQNNRFIHFERWETVRQSWACCWWAADLCSFSEIMDVLVSSRLPLLFCVDSLPLCGFLKRLQKWAGIVRWWFS